MITVSPTAMIPTNARRRQDRLEVAPRQEAGRRRGAVDRHAPRAPAIQTASATSATPERPALEAEAARQRRRRSRRRSLSRSGSSSCPRGSPRRTPRRAGRPTRSGRRRCVTTTSARSSTSSSSVDEKITAVPLRAASRTRLWISARPPTSTPRVGSSSASSAVPSSCERPAEQHLLLVAAAEARGRRAEPVERDAGHGRELARRCAGPGGAAGRRAGSAGGAA